MTATFLTSQTSQYQSSRARELPTIWCLWVTGCYCASEVLIFFLLKQESLASFLLLPYADQHLDWAKVKCQSLLKCASKKCSTRPEETSGCGLFVKIRFSWSVVCCCKVLLSDKISFRLETSTFSFFLLFSFLFFFFSPLSFSFFFLFPFLFFPPPAFPAYKRQPVPTIADPKIPHFVVPWLPPILFGSKKNRQMIEMTLAPSRFVVDHFWK